MWDETRPCAKCQLPAHGFEPLTLPHGGGYPPASTQRDAPTPTAYAVVQEVDESEAARGLGSDAGERVRQAHFAVPCMGCGRDGGSGAGGAS